MFVLRRALSAAAGTVGSAGQQPPPTAIQPVEYNDREGEHQAGVFVGVIFSIFNIIVRAAVVLTTKWQNKSAREGRNGHRRSPWPKSRSYVSKPPRARSPRGGASRPTHNGRRRH